MPKCKTNCDKISRQLYKNSTKFKSEPSLDKIRKYVEQRFDTLHSLNNIFLASFCLPDYVSRNDGLLSMWRAYGIDGGYAIVFDTNKLWNSFKEHMSSFQETRFRFHNIIYSEIELLDPQNDELVENFNTIYNFFDMSKNEARQRAEEEYTAYGNLSLGIKHQGFREEKEVRLSVLLLKYDDKNPNFPPKDVIKLPEIQKNSNKNYIALEGTRELFLNSIKEIVIGPDSKKENRKKEIEKFLSEQKLHIPVNCSSIPFIGMHT